MKKRYFVRIFILAGSLLRQLSAFFQLRARRVGLWIALGLLAALAFGPPPAHAAVTEAWVHRYSNLGDSVDQASKVLRDAAGDFLVVGATADNFAVQGLLIIKYSGADGSVLWQRRYDGPEAVLISLDPAASVLAAVVDASGNVVVTRRADGTNGFADYYTAKYAAADGALLWERRYNGPAHGSDIPSAVAVDGSGNVVVTGFSKIGMDEWFITFPFPTDCYTAKYAAADGALLWEKSYDGPTHGWDFATSVAVDASGNVVVTGGSYNEIDNNGLPYDSDYYTAKYAAADGALLWEKHYSGPANSDDIAQAVAVDPSGNVVVTGYSYGFSSWHDYYTVKYAAADGAFLWEKRYDGPAHNLDVPTALVVDSGGNVVVTGYSYSDNSHDNFYTAKYAATNGALLWERRYNGPVNYYDEPTALAVDASGNVVVTGFSYGLSSSLDYYTAKYAAANGALLWEKRYNGPTNGHDIAKGVAVDASGNVVVTGYSNNDFYTAEYAAVNGALLWERGYSGPCNLDDQAQAVAVDGVGNVVVTGYSRSASASDYDYYTAKYAAADGALLWERRYNGPANAGDYGQVVAVDASGNVVVTGNSAGTGAYTAKYAAGDGALLWEKLTSFVVADMALDASGNVLVTGRASGYYTAKYAAANGALLWERRGGNGEPDGSSLAVDASGNVVVSGSFFDGITFYYNSYTAKYAAADGAILWERSNNGSEDYYLLAEAAAVDAGGNVLVVGLSGSGGDFYTAKYAAATGALLWEKSYNGPVDGEDFAQAVAVDASGNVVVTGYSDGATDGLNFYRDYYTAKYAAANGALLWERRYNGPANRNDSANAVAVDAGGNVVVTGYSVGNTNSTERDYYTAAYAAADGALLWEKRYNGPANGDDFVGGPHSLALGPNGMVAITGASDGAFGRSSYTYDYATVVYRELPSAPRLSIAQSNAFVTVSWPVTGLNFQLHESTNLFPAAWSPVAQAAATNAGQVSVTVPTTAGRKFFGLKSQ